MSKYRPYVYSFLLVWLFIGILPAPALAHVKWFTDFSFLDRPQSFSEVLSATFLGLAVFSMVGMGIAVVVDRRLEQTPLYLRIRSWLESHKDSSTLVLRIGMGMTFLLSWQDNSLLAPYLNVNDTVGWTQFVLTLLLIFPQTTPIAGAGTILLWFIGVFDFGLFYMLDYLAFVGIGAWLLFSGSKDQRIRALGVPALYFTVGFSLLWLGIEKVIYPQWGIDILEANPQLTLGFPADFFLTGAAFVEIVLGYLLIIGLLGRPLGLIVTLVFFTTTTVFGKVEVIGHTHLHAALIVFLLNGPGRIYPAPIDIHNRMTWRVAFAAVNFVLLLAIFLGLYSFGANATYEHRLEETITEDHITACRALIEDGENPDEAVIVVEGDEELRCSIVLDYADPD